jgi:hypothetical protein
MASIEECKTKAPFFPFKLGLTLRYVSRAPELLQLLELLELHSSQCS